MKTSEADLISSLCATTLSPLSITNITSGRPKEFAWYRHEEQSCSSLEERAWMLLSSFFSFFIWCRSSDASGFDSSMVDEVRSLEIPSLFILVTLPGNITCNSFAKTITDSTAIGKVSPVGESDLKRSHSIFKPFLSTNICCLSLVVLEK